MEVQGKQVQEDTLERMDAMMRNFSWGNVIEEDNVSREMIESEVQIEGRYFYSLNFTFTWERRKCSAKWKMHNDQRLIHLLPFMANLPQTTAVWTWALNSN